MPDSTNVLIKRDTAQLLTREVLNPCAGLLAEDVPLGSKLVNFDITSDEGMDVLDAANGVSTREWMQHIERPFLCQWWVFTKVEFPDLKSGEMIKHVRVALISPELEVLSFASHGVINSVDDMRASHGDGPYVPPLEIKCVPQSTRSNQTVIKLRARRAKPSNGQL